MIPRDYIGYGFRARAQEVAQERLGDLSRQDAERRARLRGRGRITLYLPLRDQPAMDQEEAERED